jgi:hypothetical protein
LTIRRDACQSEAMCNTVISQARGFLETLRPFFSLVLLLLAGLGCGGCASSTGTTGGQGASSITLPASGQAKVIFVRPSPTGRGSATTFRIHEGEVLIGILPHKSYFVYECSPGRHIFSTSYEDVALLEANLLANRIYYIEVAARVGWVTEQVDMISIHPGSRSKTWSRLPQILPKLRETAVSPELAAHDRTGIANYLTRIDKYYREKYLPNSNRDQVLPEYGLMTPVGTR